ncbi:MAG: ABC transporter permease [Candidatus Hydrogenedentota bacterium]|nr:MAG: ABC transporter permease [Candidatus Hydrogenedentota bacterium]
MTDTKKKKIHWGPAWGEAKDLIWRHRKRLSIGLGLMLISRSAGFVLPYSSKIFMDEIIPNKNMELLQQLVMIVGITTVIQAITTYALSQIMSVAAQRAIMDMRKSVQQHITRLPTSFFDETKSGVLISRIMTDPEGIRNLVGTGLTQMIGGILTASVAFAYLLYLNWTMTLIILFVLAVFGGGMAYAFNRLRPIFRKRGEINADVTGRLNESLGGVRVVKAYTAEKREDILFAEGVHKLFRNVASSITGVSAITAFSTVIIGGIGILVMTLGGNAVMQEPGTSGYMTLGDLISYLLFTGLVVAPLVNMANIGTQITDAFAGLDRIREIKQTPTEGQQQEGMESLGQLNGDISFENVTFEYDEGVPVLKNISFEAKAGTTTALVGSSGSGKSTLIGLVMAFHYPKSGRILIDGRDLTNIPLKDYRSHLGVVMQDNFLFEGTIADNIRYSKPHATIEEIRRVGLVSHVAEFVDQFEDGYDTIVGERGVKLSGGQRQRVAIARAILANPDILILDEATASLDSESEAKIQDGLETLREGRTSFIIAHRLSTIQSADQILVVEHGEIVERGSHTELLELDGRYKQLYDKQYKFEMNRFINPGEEIAIPEA